MKSALLAFQKALYERLRTRLSVPVYDAVPDGAAFPYVTLGEDTAVDWSTKLQAGQEITHTLHVWSRYPGMAEAKQIIDAVVQALTAEPLAVEGFAVVVFRFDWSEVLRDPDGITRHGVVRFRAKLQEV